MKKIISILFVLSWFYIPCNAQFGTLRKIYQSVKNAGNIKNEVQKVYEDKGNVKTETFPKSATIDTTSVEYKEALAKVQNEMYESNPLLKKISELKDDTVALNKYLKEQYGGMSSEEIARKTLEDSGVDFDSEKFQKEYEKYQKMSGVVNDPVYKKAITEQRQLTMEEAVYLNDKYGTDYEYAGMEAYNDSVGVYVCINGKMKSMRITQYDKITNDRPIPDFGQSETKQYIQDFLGFLKNPLKDREIVDSVQNYMIYNRSHAEEQFKGVARFTLYSNAVACIQEYEPRELLLRKISSFTNPIDPKNIFVLKVHRGIDCRFMEYMYSKIKYRQSELTDYVTKRLIDEGYIDANIDQRLSDEELFGAMTKMEYQFKVDKLINMLQNDEKFRYANVIPAARNVKLTSKSRKIGHVTALDICIEAEPGEYAFVIRNVEEENDSKQSKSEKKDLNNLDISILAEGTFFFTIK